MMHKIKNLFFWWLDYIYVAWWQMLGYISRYDATQLTKHADPLLPPILLIPGVYEKWQFMKPIATLLASQGYTVHVIEGLGYNTGNIEDMASIVADYINKHELRGCVIVAHSKGGLIGKYLLMNRTDDTAIQKMIALNTPFSGSKYAAFLPLQTIKIFTPSSQIITLLAAHTTTNQYITSIYAAFDPHIPGGSYLEGATNIQLNIAGHFRIMHNKKVHQAILDALNASYKSENEIQK